MVLGVLAGFALAPARFDFYANGPYDRAVPRPDAILGYGIGSRHSTFRDQEQVVLKIADAAKGKVRVFEYGKSTQGRPLRIVAISSPANISRLEAIRADLDALAKGRADATLLRRAVPIVWINQVIHGDETASFESAMPLIYNLAASKSLERVLENVVVIVNPVYNPDGHERYVVAYNAVARGSSAREAFESYDPPLFDGRTNHYRFDMNRDRVGMTQEETRAEAREYLRWNPQVYVDQHGQTTNYFFPPNPMAINANVDRARLNRWTEIFGRATAKAFDARGWAYFVREAFDLFYAGYLDSWASLSGAIGMTHETDGGLREARLREDGSTITLRDGAEKHFEAALAVIETAAGHRPKLIESYAAFKRKAVEGTHAPFRHVVVTDRDPRPLRRLQILLDRSGIQSTLHAAQGKLTDAQPFGSSRREAVTLDGYALSVPMAQPQGPLAKALLEPQAEFEAEFIKEQLAKIKAAPKEETYPGPEWGEFYDLAGWSVPYLHGLQAYLVYGDVTLGKPLEDPKVQAAKPSPRAVGYAIEYRDRDDALAALDILAAGVRGFVATKPMRVEDRTFSEGTIYFLAARNEDGYAETVLSRAAARGVTPVALTTSYPGDARTGPGSGSAEALAKPNIGVLFGTESRPTGFGSIWYLLDREFRLPFTALRGDSLNARTLAKYTVLIAPPGSTVAENEPVKEWVRGGGTLIMLAGEAGVGERRFVKLEESGKDLNYLPGGLFLAEMDPRSFLTYGYPRPAEGKPRIPVPVEGTTFYKAPKEGGTAVRLLEDEKTPRLLSGWVWPDETEKALAGTVWLHDVPLGRGHAILFMQNPAERAKYAGLEKMLLNAILFGPSP